MVVETFTEADQFFDFALKGLLLISNTKRRTLSQFSCVDKSTGLKDKIIPSSNTNDKHNNLPLHGLVEKDYNGGYYQNKFPVVES